jgi:hypothetical protein
VAGEGEFDEAKGEGKVVNFGYLVLRVTFGTLAGTGASSCIIGK